MHIAAYGELDHTMILRGIKYLPISRLVLLTLEKEREAAAKFAGRIGRTLEIPTEVYGVKPPILYNTLSIFADIIAKNMNVFNDIIVNVSSGDKQLVCAALIAAFVNGVKTKKVSYYWGLLRLNDIGGESSRQS